MAALQLEAAGDAPYMPRDLWRVCEARWPALFDGSQQAKNNAHIATFGQGGVLLVERLVARHGWAAYRLTPRGVQAAEAVAGGRRLAKVLPTLPVAPLRRCRHCKAERRGHCRGLCSRCHRDLEIRAQYPPAQDCAGRDFSGRATPPAFATAARPGSEEKIAVLAERFRLKQTLWHPADVDLGTVAVILEASA